MPADDEIPDTTLLDRFVRHGDESAFAALVRRHHGMAFATALRICGDRAEAQDVLQQALIVLARRAGELGDVRSLGAWLHRVVVLEAGKSRQRTHKRRLRETMAYQIGSMAREAEDNAAKLLPELDRSLDALPAKDREVLTLHYLQGHTFKSIQQLLGGTAEGWQKRSVRALEKLATRLHGRGVTVSAITLATVLTTSRTEAAVTSAFLESATRRALDQALVKTTGLSAKLALLLTMKTGIAISLTSGVILAYGWGATTRATRQAHGESIAHARHSTLQETTTAFRSRPQAFTLEMVRQAVSDHEAATERRAITESRLRSLMFLVPQAHLEDTLEILMGVKDKDRFQQVAAALFGRWAELDPEAALARANASGDYSRQGRRAVMITWLNQDGDAALASIFSNKSEENRSYLNEFVVYQCERAPHEAAVLVDRVAQEWPEADRELFETVAKLWSRSDPLPAGDWVASCQDEDLKNQLLRTMAVDVSKTRGFDGLTIANHIGDAKARADARNDAIYWWGVSCGGYSIIPGKTRPYRDLTGGFPSDWTDENIRTFALTTMVNFSKNLPDLLRIATDDHQRQLIYEGAVKGVGWSNPAAVTEAAEALPDSFARSPSGSEILGVFIRRWSEMDAKAAATWLERQPAGPKTDAMRDALQTGKSK